MKSHFSWETDRHQDWIEDEETTPEPPGWTAGLTRRRLLLVIVLQIGLVFALMVWLVVRRQQSLEWRIGEDVVASHRILQQAVAAQDLELFTSFLSKENSAWLKAQRELLAAGSVMGRDALGLALQPTSSNPSVELSPDWRQAELTFAQQYLATDLGGTIRPVRLQHTAVYRYYRTQRWLQVPPDEAFWGKTVTNADDTGLLTVEYPERDSSWSQRLGEDLRKALQAMCTGQPSGACNGLHVTLQLTTDPAVLVSLAERPTPIFDRRAFVMPAPTLVGIPLDEESYQALYDAYTERILETVRNNSQAPIPIPEQVVQLLCRDGLGRGLQPYQYDPWFDIWSPVPTEEAYNYLRPMPEDSGVVLRRGLPGTQLYDLELSLLRDGQTYPLVELSGNEEELVSLVGFAPGPQSRLLVRLNDRSVSNVDYQALNVDACAAGQCVLELMTGFPVWSPDGRHVLLADEGKIYRQDWRELPFEVGNGFNAFWLTADTYGYVRFDRENASPTMQLIVASIHDDEPRVLLTTSDLVRLLNTRPLAITYAAISPASSNTVYLAVTSTSINQKFYIVSFRMPTDGTRVPPDGTAEALTVHLQLDDLPQGEATLLTPTGFPPFGFSPDGRFLLLVDRARSGDLNVDHLVPSQTASGASWVIMLYDTYRRETQTTTLEHPAYPARFPFYDWSADGRWLITVDDGLLNLIAPEYGYKRLVTHDLGLCYHAGWTDITNQR